MPAMVAMLQTFDTVLFIPECVEHAMQVQVSLESFDTPPPAVPITGIGGMAALVIGLGILVGARTRRKH